MSSLERNTETEGCIGWCHKRCSHREGFDQAGSSQMIIDQGQDGLEISEQLDAAVAGLKQRFQEEISKMEEAIRQKVKGLEAEVAGLRRKEKRLEAELTEMKERESKCLKTEIDELELRLQEKRVKLSNIEASRRNSTKGEVTFSSSRSLLKLEAGFSSMEEKNRDLSATNQKLCDEMKARLTEQENKPPSKVLVRKPDSISLVEVEELVQILNARIDQLSSRIMDSPSYRELPGSGAELDVLNDLGDYLGPWLLDALRRRPHKSHLIPQVALQTVLVHGSSRIINHWNPPFWNDSSIIFRVYSNMGGVGAGHVINGTWSALARTMSQSEVQDANVKYLSGILVKVMAAIGGPLPNGETLPLEHQEDVDDITKRALELRQIFGKEVKSMDLVTCTVPSDTQFNPSEMDDTEGSADEAGCVVCTVEMGLQYRKRAELGKPGGGQQCGVTLKPKVVLPVAFS